MDAIVIRDLHKIYRLYHGRQGTLKSAVTAFRRSGCEDIHALKGIDLTVRSGETLAVIGRNGSGKSTLLGTMARVYRPTSGSIAMNGRVSSLLDLGAGFHPDLTGIENIYLNGSILGLSRREISKRLEHIIAFAELHQFIDAPIRTYSNGMIMRLGFSIATQIEPDILLVDEVLAVGDEAFQHKCYDKVREFQRAGRTIVFVSHDLKAVAEVSSRVLWLDSGTVRADGAPGTVLGEYISVADYG